MSTTFAVIAVWAEDVALSAHFYHEMLGLEPSELHGSRPHFQVNGVHLTLLKGTPVPAQNADPDPFPLFALAVDDLDEMVRRLEKHHVALQGEITEGVEARWVMFHDPAGNLIELVEFAPQKRNG